MPNKEVSLRNEVIETVDKEKKRLIDSWDFFSKIDQTFD
jgi:hypothetical protein